MESFYYYIVIAGVASLLTNESTDKFRGASGYAKLWLSVGGLLGILSFLVLIITLFFFVTWWHPLVLLAITAFLSWFFGSFGRNGFVGLACSILVIIFNSLAWTYLIKYI